MSTTSMRRATAWLLSTGLILGGTAAAAEDQGRSPQKQSPQSGQMQKETNQAQRQQHSAQKSKMVSGRVMAIKSVELKGTNQRHMFTLIRTEEGNRAVIDLGPRTAARKLKLSVGDSIDARGREASINGRTVLVARQARTSDAKLTIDRSMQRRQFDRAVREAQRETKIRPSQG